MTVRVRGSDGRRGGKGRVNLDGVTLTLTAVLNQAQSKNGLYSSRGSFNVRPFATPLRGMQGESKEDPNLTAKGRWTKINGPVILNLTRSCSFFVQFVRNSRSPHGCRKYLVYVGIL